jgi:hypothetical protein
MLGMVIPPLIVLLLKVSHMERIEYLTS